MKAVVALIIIYVGTFFVAIQGASNTPVEAAGQNLAPGSKSVTAKPSIDPEKDSDIRSLLELIGARDTIQDVATNAAEQYRQKLIALAPDNEKAQASINAYVAAYQKRFDADTALDQLITVYDKHFSDDEIKGLLQFYGSPLGQKTAAEMPKISREIQLANRTLANQAAKETWQQLRADNPDAQQKRPLAARHRWQQAPAPGAVNQKAQADSQQP
jgi:hypothetical protein